MNDENAILGVPLLAPLLYTLINSMLLNGKLQRNVKGVEYNNIIIRHI